MTTIWFFPRTLRNENVISVAATNQVHTPAPRCTAPGTQSANPTDFLEYLGSVAVVIDRGVFSSITASTVHITVDTAG